MKNITLHQLNSEMRADGSLLWTEKQITLELDDQSKVKRLSPVPQAFLAEFEGKLSYFHIDQKGFLYRININAANDPHASNFINENWVPANINRLNLTLDWSVYEKAAEDLNTERKNTSLSDVCYAWLDNLAIREADPVRTMQLTAPNPEEYVRERAKRFHEDLLAAHQKKVVSELTELLSSSPVSLKEALRNYVKAHEQFVKAQRLDYTAIPDHPVMLLFIELAKQLGKLYDVPPIQILLPDVCTYPETDESYPDLSKVDLAWVLKTHVLSHSHRYLLPVRLITTELGDHNEFHNPYYSIDDTDKSSAVITAEEWSRLWRHSPQTEALKEIQDRYDLIVKDKSTLLGQLTFLCEKFLEYGVDGIGTEEKAAEPIFLILLRFFEYYDQLAQNNIPAKIRSKIDDIREQMSDSESKKRDWFRTCIANHRRDLLRLIDEHKLTLDAISIDNTKRASAIKEEGERLITARKELVESIEKFQYTGTDKLGLTCSMLTTLGVPLRINSFDELALLYCFTPEELISLASGNDSLINDVTTQLNTIENLVVFLSTALPTGHIVAFFTVFYSALNHRLGLNNCSNFRALIIALDPEKITAIFESMKDDLPNMIKTRKDFFLILQILSAEQCRAVFCTAIRDFSSIITTAEDFRIILSCVAPEQRTQFIKGIKLIITTAQDFKDVLQHLSLEECTALCAAIRNFSSIIKTAKDFSFLLSNLPREKGTLILEGIKQNLPTIIETAENFWIVFLHLFPEQHTLAFEGIKQKFSTMIKTARDFKNVLQHLSPEQRTLVFEGIKQNFSTMIKTARDFNDVLEFLSLEQRTLVFEGIKQKFSTMIKTAGDFNDVLEFLTPNQCTEVCQAMKDHLPDIINTIDDFLSVLKFLTPEQRTLVFERIKEKLWTMIKTARHFKNVLQPLPPEQRTLVFERIKEKPWTMIKTASDFTDFLEFLTPNQCTEVRLAMKDRLPNIIKTTDDFIAIFLDTYYRHKNNIYKMAIEGNWLITADTNETGINVFDSVEALRTLSSYIIWLESEFSREGDRNNWELIKTKITILNIAKHYLQQTSKLSQNETPNVKQGLMKILTASMSRSDKRIALLVPRSSMTASLFRRTISPKGEKLFYDIFGAVPDLFLGLNPPGSRLQMR